MAIPFALAVGGYSLILFLSIYATSCSLYLLVQSAKATVRWFALGDDFDFATMASVMMTAVRALLLILTMPSASTMTVTMAMTVIRLIWDPGIASRAIGLFKTFAPTVLYSRCATSSMPSPLVSMFHYHRGTSCGVAMVSASIEPIRCDPFLPWRAPVDGAAPTVDRDPFLLRPTRPMIVMFQYCHPVLSRPTVPNII